MVSIELNVGDTYATWREPNKAKIAEVVFKMLDPQSYPDPSPQTVSRGYKAIDNRVRLMVDLGTEHMAQLVSDSNIRGGHGFNGDRYTVRFVPSPTTYNSYLRRWIVRSGG